MKIRIICYEDPKEWVLGKFAVNLFKELKLYGHDVSLSGNPDPDADINHHIIYLGVKKIYPSLNTVMITHIDTKEKINLLKYQIKNGIIGICMSSQMLTKLLDAGLPSDRLSYILPAHDGYLKPRRIVIGITTRLYHDGRKRESVLLWLSKRIDPNEYSFFIMGSGWQEIVIKLRDKGFLVNYHSEFDKEIYNLSIPILDFYLYLGTDEGSLGYIDALSAGISTIATPQGFHLDAKDGLCYSFKTKEELLLIFHQIIEKKRKLTKAVIDWTWPNYAKKHVDLWEYLISGKKGKEMPYKDGVSSLAIYKKTNIIKQIIRWADLYKGSLMQKRFKKINKIKRRGGSGNILD
jgi:hypothetical protein